MQATARRAAAPAFALAMFLSAALIFALQPMFSRLTTPLLGGSPSVWNTSMVFFQAALLAGYLYAHLLQKVKDIRIQAGVHAALLVLAFLVLPVRVTDLLGEPNSDQPILWLLGVLTVSIGAPFAAASATSPLLQAWYARTGRADAHDPYYLYAASNLGSLLGLLLYPILVEPNLGAHEQSQAWTYGYGITILFIILCGMLAVWAHGRAQDGASAAAQSTSEDRPTWMRRFYWIGASAAPSSLLLGVTQHLSTDVASAPFLWVIPLAFYLIAFIIAFLRGAEKISPAVLLVHPLSLVLLAMTFMGNNWTASLFAHLVCFFLSTLICLLALSRTRPAAQHLTEFYLYISLGGVLGGALTALLAPVIFNGIYEYPLALAATALFRPRTPPQDTILDRGVAVALGLCAAVLIVSIAVSALTGDNASAGDATARGVTAAVLTVMALSLSGQTTLLTGRLASILAAAAIAMAGVIFLLMSNNIPDAVLNAGLFGAAAALAGGAIASTRAQPIALRAGYVLSAVAFAGLLLFLVGAPTREALISASLVEGELDITIEAWVRWAVGLSGFALIVFVAHQALQRDDGDLSTRLRLLNAAALGAALPLVFVAVAFMALEQRLTANAVIIIAFTLMALALFLNRNRPLLLAGLVLALFAMVFAEDNAGSRTFRQDRSFFGVLKVEDVEFPEVNNEQNSLRVLKHGTTIHGAQFTLQRLQRLPMTYYGARTALGASILAGLTTAEDGSAKLALVGLGTGTTACLMRPTDELTIFEIDPLVVRFSGPQGDTFTYVRQCQPNAHIELGDARLQLAEEPDASYDVIVVDAFSSDAIPAHLLTTEAVAMYMRKLKPTGALILHLSNRNLALVREAARVAHALHLPNRWWVSPRFSDDVAGGYANMPASAMVLTHPENQGAYAHLSAAWRVVAAPPGRPWTDDYINLPRALWENLGGETMEFTDPPAQPASEAPAPQPISP